MVMRLITMVVVLLLPNLWWSVHNESSRYGAMKMCFCCISGLDEPCKIALMYRRQHRGRRFLVVSMAT